MPSAFRHASGTARRDTAPCLNLLPLPALVRYKQDLPAWVLQRPLSFGPVMGPPRTAPWKGRGHGPRKPHLTPFYQCVQDHYETLEQVYPERFAKRYGFWRPYLKQVMVHYLSCGDLHEGFARIHRCRTFVHDFRLRGKVATPLTVAFYRNAGEDTALQMMALSLLALGLTLVSFGASAVSTREGLGIPIRETRFAVKEDLVGMTLMNMAATQVAQAALQMKAGRRALEEAGISIRSGGWATPS